MTTKEQVIQAAREAGIRRNQHNLASNPVQYKFTYESSEDALERLYNLAYKAGEKAMQERAAKVCDSVQDCGPENGCCPTYWHEALDRAIDAIRALEVSKND